MEAIESRIIDEFNIKQSRGLNKALTLSIIGMLTALVATWYLTTGNSGSIDLSEAQEQAGSEPKAEELTALAVPDSTEGENVTPADSTKVAATNKKSELPIELQTARSPEVVPTIPKTIETRITVGRIIDIKGIPVVDATVSSGAVNDTTDKSGYYAIKVTAGGTELKVSHLATEYVVEIDSHQNWEIVLDIARQEVIDYYPMNAANRFK